MGTRRRLGGLMAVAALALAPARAAANPPAAGRRLDPPGAGDAAREETPAEREASRRSLLGGPRLPDEVASTLAPEARPPSVPFGVPSPVVAGWADDLFFLSDPSHDWFVAPGARLQIDVHAFAPPHVDDDVVAGTPAAPITLPSRLRAGAQIRRARLELVGGVFSFLPWRVGAELTDNGPQTAADMHMNLRAAAAFNVQVGQFDAPFTMENRTSDRYLDFVERSLTVRALGVPTGKEIGLMLWGEDARQQVYWSAGVFNGGGPGRFAPDGQVEGAARVFFHPFMVTNPYGIGREFQVGLSGRVASRSLGGQSPYPEMVTPAGFSLFSAAAPGATIVQRGLQWAAAAEFDLPLHRFDLRGEFVYVRNETGEVDAGAALDRDPLRLGTLEGFGFYVQAGYWLLGLPGSAPRPRGAHAVDRPWRPGSPARPGYQDPPTLGVERVQTLTLPLGLQLVGRFDTVQFAYRGASVDARGRGDSGASGRYRVLAAELGLNVWITRHVRFLLDYRHYWFPELTGQVDGGVNRMRGPDTRPDDYGEFTARAAISL